jgi:hypothetical protein
MSLVSWRENPQTPLVSLHSGLRVSLLSWGETLQSPLVSLRSGLPMSLLSWGKPPRPPGLASLGPSYDLRTRPGRGAIFRISISEKAVINESIGFSWEVDYLTMRRPERSEIRGVRGVTPQERLIAPKTNSIQTHLLVVFDIHLGSFKRMPGDQPVRRTTRVLSP